MPRTRLIILAAATLLAAAALPASAAAAPSLVYAEGNIWVASPDGASKKQLTTNGGYQFPSADDSGRIVARVGATGAVARWYWLAADGTQLGIGTPAMRKCSDGISSSAAGPFWARVDPSGTYVAYNYICGLYSLRVAVDAVGSFGFNEHRFWSGYWDASWFGKRLVASSGGSYVHADLPDAPTGDLSQWLGSDEGSIARVEVARNGTFSLVEVELSSEASRLQFLTGNPDNPGGGRCVLPATGRQFSHTISPDGTLVAWNDGGGVKVARVPDLSDPATEGQPCALAAEPVVISANGRHPAFTAYDYFPAPTPPPPPAGDTGRPDLPIPPVEPGIDVALPTRIKDAALARGVKLKLNATVPGNLTVRATAPAKTAKRLGVKVKRRAKTAVVATGSLRAVAGENTVTLRLVSKARRRAARLKGARLTLTLTLKPTTGAAITVTRTLRIQ
jgi:hypothetical protein